MFNDYHTVTLTLNRPTSSRTHLSHLGCKPRRTGGTTIQDAFTETHTIYINMGAPAQPHIYHEQLGYSCEYQFCVDPVANATGYKWSYNGGSTYGSVENLLCSDNTYYYGSSYNIKVKAVNDCGESSPASSSGTLPSLWPCMAKIESDSNVVKKESSSIKFYPSPSSGYLWLENNNDKNIIVILKTVSGVIISKTILVAGEKKELENLPPGMIILESRQENGNSIFERKLIPVINIH